MSGPIWQLAFYRSSDVYLTTLYCALQKSALERRGSQMFSLSLALRSPCNQWSIHLR
ncbi:hypothetical protein EG68_11306 [Paragonimus skrjabini miyazakii]|uniref:Uncharacterized protein n=1 Tax=Paragonimus skrjabini miyazakii TaxID=59628 RepID=A0A8S9YLL6_9TREM|nr:hypothetical protein EG68_11306 [Paragonimus skrjabini miyazakii]